MTREEAMEKITKLLRTQGRTCDEAETAQRLAAALADKHDIDLSQLDREEQERVLRVGQESLGRWRSVPPEASLAARIIRNHFDVQCISVASWEGTELVQIGMDHHRAIAGHVFEFVVAAFRKAWSRRTNRRLRKRADFMEGLYRGLSYALACAAEEIEKDATPDQAGLVAATGARIEAYMRERWPNATTTNIKPRSCSGSLQAGFRAGMEIEINPAVTAPTARPAGLLA